MEFRAGVVVGNVAYEERHGPALLSTSEYLDADGRRSSVQFLLPCKRLTVDSERLCRNVAETLGVDHQQELSSLGSDDFGLGRQECISESPQRHAADHDIAPHDE